MTVASLFPDVSESLDRYERRSTTNLESSNGEDEKAERCLEFEETIAFGLSIYDLINRVDENWRRKVHKKLLPYSAEVENTLLSLFSMWLNTCERIDKQLAAFEKQGLDAAWKEEFRAACREVKGILTADDEFFVGDTFDRLTNDAHDTHEARETEEFGSLRD